MSNVQRRPFGHAVAGPGRAGQPLGFGGSLAGKHRLDPAMWRRTANRLRNRQQLESSSWPVFKFKQSESRWARVSVTPEPWAQAVWLGSKWDSWELNLSAKKKIENLPMVPPGRGRRP